MAPRVLVSDKLSQTALDIFSAKGVDVDFLPDLGKDKAALLQKIGDYDGLAIRSTTKVTAKLIKAASRLKIVGRAGIGIDNVDLAEATRRGIIVMNTPYGNSETTAEHAIALMFALARQIPEASASTKNGRWEKSRFMGTELIGKTIGVIGCGNIGSAVCRRANGLGMQVIGYDPYLSSDRARHLGVEKVELNELFNRSDFITLHVPLTDKTRNLINASALKRMKQGARIINCARGNIIDESALLEAIKSGHIAGAALDVFAVEPPENNPLLKLPQIIATPHLGASTMEAQEKVAQQIASQMSDYLLNGAVTNAINMPSISTEEASRLKPWINLANHLGAFAGQMTDEPIKAVNVLFDGSAAELNTDALSAVAIAGILKVSNPEVNMVSAESIAQERDMVVSATIQSKSGVFDAYMKLTVFTPFRERSVVGTVFSDGKPRFIQIKGIYIDAEISRFMLYTTNDDIPGIIGDLGNTMGRNGVNIANFKLGRSGKGKDAIALLSVDTPISNSVANELRKLGKFNQVRPLEFDVLE